MVLLLGALPAVAKSRASGPVKVPMTASQWTTDGLAGFVQFKGKDAIELKPADRAKNLKTGSAIANGVVFGGGTIEFDVFPTGAMGAAIGFRRRDKDTFEDFYLRPSAKCMDAPDCIQYAPQTHGVLLWDVFPQFQAPAPLRQDEWNHVRMVVSGQRLRIFINGSQTPSLEVGRLEGDVDTGGIVLQGPGIFANLTVTPDAVKGLSAEPDSDVTVNDVRYVRNWELSPFSTLEDGKEPGIAEIPAPTAEWKALAAERGGLVNITREYGLPLARPTRALAWVKTTIVSDKSQTKKADFGWVREAWVFVNGKPVFAGRNLYQPATARMTPDGRCSLENGSFNLPLKEGANELDVAVADNFYGWGLILRLDDVDGVRLARK
jgi:hypothetical protein